MTPPVALPLQPWLEAAITAAYVAGEAVMAIYAGPIEVQTKGDHSPVTLADAQAEAIILSHLHRLEPQLPVVAEEAVAANGCPTVGRSFWLVDPLDGTREFINRNGEFTVNIALVSDGVPVLGVVYAPAMGLMYAGAHGYGAWRIEADQRLPLACRPVPDAGLTVVASRSHGDAAALDAFLAGRKVAEVVNSGSSLKLCLLACGQADLYPRLGRTMEWDIAAGHAVLLAAGGDVLTLDGLPMRYGKAGFENPHFVAGGSAHFTRP